MLIVGPIQHAASPEKVFRATFNCYRPFEWVDVYGEVVAPGGGGVDLAPRPSKARAITCPVLARRIPILVNKYL